MKNRSKYCVAAGALFIACTAMPAFAGMQSASYRITNSVLSGGGGTLSSASYRMQASISQPTSLVEQDDPLQSAGFKLFPGFWYGLGLGSSGTSTTTTTPDDNTIPPCDDGVFCNGAESAVDGVCAAGSPPCAEDELCMEQEKECWTVSDIEARSFKQWVMRPIFSEKRCTWLVMKAAASENFSLGACTADFTGPDNGTGVSLNTDKAMREFFGFMLVPVCIEKDAPKGEWILDLWTDVDKVRETIELKFKVL